MNNQMQSEFTADFQRNSNRKQSSKSVDITSSDQRLINPELYQIRLSTPDLNATQVSETHCLPTNEAFSQLPLTAVTVHFPQPKEALINGYMLYKVSFTWNGKDFEVIRRFSDFQALRKAICCYLPFTFVFPIHKKQFIVL